MIKSTVKQQLKLKLWELCANSWCKNSERNVTKLVLYDIGLIVIEGQTVFHPDYSG